MPYFSILFTTELFQQWSDTQYGYARQWHWSSGTRWHAKMQEKGKERFVRRGERQNKTPQGHIMMNQVHKFSYCTAVAWSMSPSFLKRRRQDSGVMQLMQGGNICFMLVLKRVQCKLWPKWISLPVIPEACPLAFLSRSLLELGVLVWGLFAPR